MNYKIIIKQELLWLLLELWLFSSACPAQLQAQIDLLNGMYLSDEQKRKFNIIFKI